MEKVDDLTVRDRWINYIFSFRFIFPHWNLIQKQPKDIQPFLWKHPPMISCPKRERERTKSMLLYIFNQVAFLPLLSSLFLSLSKRAWHHTIKLVPPMFMNLTPIISTKSQPPWIPSQATNQSLPLTSQDYHHHHHHPTPHHLCIATLTGDNSYTASIALAGKFLYTGSSDKEIWLWSRDTLTSELHDENLTEYKVTAGNGAVKSLVILADKLISAHQDPKIHVWKIDSHEADHNKLSLLATLPTFSDCALKLLNPKNQVKIRRHKKCTSVHLTPSCWHCICTSPIKRWLSPLISFMGSNTQDLANNRLQMLGVGRKCTWRCNKCIGCGVGFSL